MGYSEGYPMERDWRDQLMWFIRSPFVWYIVYGLIMLLLAWMAIER